MIKLLVSDMDGTLFNSKQEISPLNLAAIQSARQQGVRFMIATGRSIDTIGPTVEKYELECGLILMNGAEIRDEQGNILHTENIEKNTIPVLNKRLEEMGYIPEYMTEQGSHLCGSQEKMEINMGYRMLCLDRNHTLTLEEAIEQGKNSIFMKNLTRVDSVEEICKREIRKIIVFHPNPEINVKNRALLQQEFPELSILSSYPENIEINAKLAQKGLGLKKAIEKMGILPSEVAVFGDGLNDLSMIEQFSHSYAPENAQPDLKSKASEIIPSNNEDGVGKKIFEILYKNKEEAINQADSEE